MSKIDRLLGKGEKISFKVGKEDIEFSILPLKNRELLEVMKLAEDKNIEEMMTKMVFYSLNKDDPTITMEQVKEMPYLFDFLKVITRVNHLGDMFDFKKKQEIEPSPKKMSVEDLNKNPRKIVS